MVRTHHFSTIEHDVVNRSCVLSAGEETWRDQDEFIWCGLEGNSIKTLFHKKEPRLLHLIEYLDCAENWATGAE